MGLSPVANAPEPQPEPVPPLAWIAKEFWVEAEGTVEIEGQEGEGEGFSIEEISVPGRLRMHYRVFDDGRVQIPVLSAKLDDVDLVIKFSWWEAAEIEIEPLRCTSFRNPEVLGGTLSGSQISIPAGAELIGQSYFQRNSKGQCEGAARYLGSSSPASMQVLHLPEDNQFSFSGTFDTEWEGNPLTLALDFEGTFLNRPPVAVVQVLTEGIEVDSDGCPWTRKGEPPIALANTSEGLEIELRSESHDPDGGWTGVNSPKRLRVDLNFEHWERTRSGGFAYLGSGREVGPILFETGMEHQLLLWATDRRGAEARRVCHFVVEEPS